MSDISGPLILIAVAVVVVLAIAMSVRRVKPDDRLVVFRMGRTNESLVLGPGWVFLIPIVDRPVTVTLRPQHFVIENLPARTADERDIGVDLDLRLRIHDPLRFVVAIITPAELGLRGLARTTVKRVAAGMSVGDTLTSGRLEDALRPALEGLLAERGCAEIEISLARVRALRVVEEDERITLAMWKAAGLPPVPDVTGRGQGS